MISGTSNTWCGSWLRFASSGAWLVFALLVVACRPNQSPLVIPSSAGLPSETLGPGDLLEIRVRDHDDLTGKYQVGDDGTIRFPWIGVVEVANHDPRHVAEEIETRLRDGWLRKPQVAVLIESRQNREFSVLGQVKEPGSYPFKERLTLVQAISLAGGMSPLAQTRRVKLIRQTDKGRQTFEVDVTAILDSRVVDLPLEPGDIVFVPESPI